MTKINVKYLLERRIVDLDESEGRGSLLNYMNTYKDNYDIELFSKDNEVWIRMLSKD